MRRLLSVILLFTLLLALSVPAFAADWPPETYVMPRTVISSEDVASSLSGFKISLGSIVNIGLVIFGILTSVLLISSIFKKVFLGSLHSSKQYNTSSDGSYRETKL